MDQIRLLEVKSKFDAEYRRIGLNTGFYNTFERFYNRLEELHQLVSIPFIIQYIDPKDNELLPINNDANLVNAFKVSKSILRLLLLRKGEVCQSQNPSTSLFLRKDPANIIRNYGSNVPKTPQKDIRLMDDFRPISSIIDVDLIPETLRRVRLIRHGDKPLGFYIREGVSYMAVSTGMIRVAGIFISRLQQGGLAESTGLLAVNDEIIEVNGIEVRGKSIDQVTDMMVANSQNLTITVKPNNQNNCLPAKKDRSSSSQSQANSYKQDEVLRKAEISSTSVSSSKHDLVVDDDEADVVNRLVTL